MLGWLKKILKIQSFLIEETMGFSQNIHHTIKVLSILQNSTYQRWHNPKTELDRQESDWSENRFGPKHQTKDGLKCSVQVWIGLVRFGSSIWSNPTNHDVQFCIRPNRSWSERGPSMKKRVDREPEVPSIRFLDSVRYAVCFALLNPGWIYPLVDENQMCVYASSIYSLSKMGLHSCKWT